MRADDKRLAAFRTALDGVLASLSEQIARDGEGARKLVEVVVEGAVLTSGGSLPLDVLDAKVTRWLAARSSH